MTRLVQASEPADRASDDNVGAATIAEAQPEKGKEDKAPSEAEAATAGTTAAASAQVSEVGLRSPASSTWLAGKVGR